MRFYRLVAWCALGAAACSESQDSTCEAVECGAGQCVIADGRPSCNCEPGYVADGLLCVPAAGDADADSDADSTPDADSDADSTPDADSDADSTPDADGEADSTPDADSDADSTPDADPDIDPFQPVTTVNPVIPTVVPDPHVLRTVNEHGQVRYYLTGTAGAQDIAIYSSDDLINWTHVANAFDRAHVPGNSLEINGHHYCAIWAPQIVELGPSAYMLSFSAQRFSSPQTPCPAYGEDGGVYLASSTSPTGPFAVAERPWEPLPAGGHATSCPAEVRDNIPRSVDVASRNCQGGFCHRVIRLDSDVFHDTLTGRYWLAYSWFTNSPPLVEWEHNNQGEHVHIVELDPADPFAVLCDPHVTEVHAANPHDAVTLERLRTSCDRCGEMLSFTRGRHDEEMMRDGFSWGVAEGANLIRRGDYVYFFASGSGWDAAYYDVYWVAAPTVEGLAIDNPERLVGRYLIPSGGQAFGHGTAVVGPDGRSWYFVHHRLNHPACRDQGNCGRDVWLSPIEFEDRGDGRGDVWIRPRFPEETPEVTVLVPMS